MTVVPPDFVLKARVGVSLAHRKEGTE